MSRGTIYTNMAKFEKRLRARMFRRKGWSIRAIALRLGVSRSSASVWCRDLHLTKKQNERLFRNTVKAGLVGRIKGAQVNHEKKEARIEFHRQEGEKQIYSLSRRECLIAGTALYWAEGSRKSKLGFTNSEPKMIMFMLYWFEHVMGVEKEDFMPRIFVNAIHKPRIEKILKFWSDLLELPRNQFGNPVFLKRRPRKVYENYDTYYGVLALEVRRSTELKYCILGLIEALKKSPNVLPV